MKSRLPGLLLWTLAGLPAAVSASSAAAQDADAPTAPPSPGGAATPVQAGNLPDLSIAGWTVPPIRFGGNTGSTYIYNTNFAGTTTLTNTEMLTGRAASYIYAPWFAQINANAGVSTTGSSNKSGDSSNKAKSTSFNYGANLNLFPQSRFPFSAYFDSSDSRAKATSSGAGNSGATTQYQSLRLGARQFYRPPSGNDSMNASADHSVVTSGSMSSIVNAFQGGYSTSYEDHGIAAAARYSTTSGDVGGQGSALLTLNGSHTWRIPEEGLTISNSLNFSRSDLKTLSTLGGSGLIVNNSQVLQGASSFNWLPDEDLPLTVSGGAAFLNTATDTEATRTTLTNFNGFANASYRINTNLTATAGASVAATSSTVGGGSPAIPEAASGAAPTRTVTTTQFGSLSYMGDPLAFGNFSYNWGGGGNLSNLTSSAGSGNRLIGGSAQHGVTTSLPVSETSTVALNATQSVGVNVATGALGGTRNTTLNHQFGAVWRATVGPVSVATLSANASDTYSTGTNSNHLRSFIGSGNFQTQLSARASLGASAHIAASQQLSAPTSFTTVTTTSGTTTTTQPATTWSGNGNVFYTHRNPFDIANLVYTASFMANATQSNLRVVSGDPNALSWQVARVFNNQANYRIGRLVFQATGSIAWTGDGKKSASVFGSINREIGDF